MHSRRVQRQLYLLSAFIYLVSDAVDASHYKCSVGGMDDCWMMNLKYLEGSGRSLIQVVP